MPILRVLIVAGSLRRGVEQAKDLAVMVVRSLALQCTRRHGHCSLSSIPQTNTRQGSCQKDQSKRGDFADGEKDERVQARKGRRSVGSLGGRGPGFGIDVMVEPAAAEQRDDRVVL